MNDILGGPGRHRFLDEVVAHQPKRVVGVLEADEAYILESQKGSRSQPRKLAIAAVKPAGKGAS